ncbi:MAG TPA: helix-turn-helix domain-containing protein [Hanamia sp.]|nr:helix-turn-helix domain-containing protein [Hanamia sp.]
MDNITLEFPIEQIIERLREAIRQELLTLNVNSKSANEPPINTKQLCEFLDITEPTCIRWRKKGKIPFFTIGSAIRYDKNKVVKALEENSGKIKNRIRNE